MKQQHSRRLELEVELTASRCGAPCRCSGRGKLQQQEGKRVGSLSSRRDLREEEEASYPVS